VSSVGIFMLYMPQTIVGDNNGVKYMDHSLK